MHLFGPVVPALNLEEIDQPYHEAIRTCHRLEEDASPMSTSESQEEQDTCDEIQWKIPVDAFPVPDFFEDIPSSTQQSPLLPSPTNPHMGSVTARVIRPRFTFDDDTHRHVIPVTARNPYQSSPVYWGHDTLLSTQSSTSFNQTATSTVIHPSDLQDLIFDAVPPVDELVGSSSITASSTPLILNAIGIVQSEVQPDPRVRRILRRLRITLKRMLRYPHNKPQKQQATEGTPDSNDA